MEFKTKKQSVKTAQLLAAEPVVELILSFYLQFF